MKISYQHANPRRGHESYYIKFDDQGVDEKMCLLIDSGENVSVADDLSDNEYLAGICLTHAHGDHYATLPKNVTSGTDVYTSPDTAHILSKILEEADKHDNIGDSQNVINSLQPIDDWVTLWDNVEIRPIPVGHCPGAVGFIIRFRHNNTVNNILCTGDFTFNSVCGNTGLQKQYPVEIDAMFMNSSITGVDNESFQTSLNNSIKSILSHVHSNNGDVLVSASSLTSVHYAYLLGHLIDELEYEYNVCIVGHSAKLFENLQLDVPNITSFPDFSDPEYVMSQSNISIAAPSVPVNSTSKRLFNEIKNNRNATLVQILSGNNYDPIKNSRCTVESFDYKAHPTQAAIDEFVDVIAPKELIIEHGRTNTYGSRYHHTLTWSNKDYKEYTIYENGWQAPPWINEDASQSILENHKKKRQERTGIETTDFPRFKVVDASIESEGIELDLLQNLTNIQNNDTRKDGEVSPELLEHIDEQFTEIHERMDNFKQIIEGEKMTGEVVGVMQDGSVMVKIDQIDTSTYSEGDKIILQQLSEEENNKDN